MQVSVDIPDHIAQALPNAGESLEESVVRAAVEMAEAQIERRRKAVQDILALRQRTQKITIDEILEWKAEGRR